MKLMVLGLDGVERNTVTNRFVKVMVMVLVLDSVQRDTVVYMMVKVLVLIRWDTSVLMGQK